MPNTTEFLPTDTANVSVGKNSVVFGITTADDYPDGYLASGKTLIKAGDKQ